MTDTVLQVFEGLTASEAQQLRQAIIPTLQKLRDEITKQEQNEMSTELLKEAFEGLNEEEQAEVLARASDVGRAAIIADMERVKTQKAGVQKHELLRQCIAEIQNENAWGKSWIVNRIKAKYVGMGLDFGKISFSTNGGKITGTFVE
jgi:hypothetical protein